MRRQYSDPNSEQIHPPALKGLHFFIFYFFFLYKMMQHNWEELSLTLTIINKVIPPFLFFIGILVLFIFMHGAA